MRIFLLALFLVFSLPALAAEAPRHSKARLVSPVAAAGKGAFVPVAVEVTLEEGWKTYWRTPGDAGLGPAFDWAGSKNFKGARVSYPAPKRITAYGLDNYGYEDRVVFPLEVEAERPGAALDLKLKLDLLACAEICLPETHRLSLKIPAGAARPSGFAAEHAKALKAVPVARDDFFRQAYLSFDRSNVNYLVVEAEAGAPSLGADLFVEHGSGLPFGKPEVWREEGRLVIAAPVRAGDSLERLGGRLAASPLTLTYVAGGTAVEGRLTLSPRPPEGVAPVETSRPAAQAIRALSGLKIALFAFIGGLILNLMPCVLPVLSMKILSVVSHGGKDGRAVIFRNFTASAAGIMAAFWALAAFVSALKAAGGAIGWGIQFQNPLFIVFLMVVVLIFAANMWGLFEIPLPRFIARNIPARQEHEPTLAGHFLSGIFATLLATPCTAPFLGTAAGFALARGTGEIFAVFTMIGLGLAAPYLVLAVSPGLFRLMPRPGAWMVGLKKGLAALLVVTALWLGGVLHAITSEPALDEGWQPFDAALVTPAVEEGRVVFVDVTADWCLTCKANKRLVLERPEIVSALSGPEVVRMQADWTRRDVDIAAYIQSYGRYGIPFNIVYGPGAPEGVLLPELLTVQAVQDALAEAAGE